MGTDDPSRRTGSVAPVLSGSAAVSADSFLSLVKRNWIWVAEAAPDGDEHARCDMSARATAVGGARVRSSCRSTFSLGLPPLDGVLPGGGMAWGALHEWRLYSASHEGSRCGNGRRGNENTVLPVLLPALAAVRAYCERSEVAKLLAGGKGGSVGGTDSAECAPYIVWIDRAAWPTPYALSLAVDTNHTGAPCGYEELLERCLFLAPPTEELKVWAIETALRSHAVCAVVARQPRRYTLPLSKRFSLAARAGGGVALLLSDVPRRFRSAAVTSWGMRAECSEAEETRWELELEQVKGALPAVCRWSVELLSGGIDEQVSLRVSPKLVDYSRAPYAAESSQTAAFGGKSRGSEPSVPLLRAGVR